MNRSVVQRAALAALLLITTAAHALADPQVPDDLFAGADKFSHGAKNSTEVNLDSKMLGMVSKMAAAGTDKDPDSKASVDLVRKLDFVIVRSYEYEKPGQYAQADVEQFQQRLQAGGWSHIVKTRGSGESTDVCVKTAPDGSFTELVVIAAEPTQLTFVHLKGRMTMDELSRAGAKFGVPQTDLPKSKGSAK